MDVTFLGVGEACDEYEPNCSVLLESGDAASPRSMLLDCGFTAPFAFWRLAERPMELDVVWISHFHGDHFFGLPALLLRLYEQRRTRPLIIVGQSGVAGLVGGILELAYAGVPAKLSYPIEYVEASPGVELRLAGFSLRCALSEHSRSNLSVRVDDGVNTVFYSGDGRPTPETLELARGVDLVIHESFSLEEDTPGHGTVPGSIAFARAATAAGLALVHIRRDVRRTRRAEIEALCAGQRDTVVTLPEAGTRVLLAAP